MRYCRNCHILYSSFADACPKCGVRPVKRTEAEAQEQADPRAARRDWLWLVIGIPVLIAVIYLAVYLVKLSAG